MAIIAKKFYKGKLRDCYIKIDKIVMNIVNKINKNELYYDVYIKEYYDKESRDLEKFVQAVREKKITLKTTDNEEKRILDSIISQVREDNTIKPESTRTLTIPGHLATKAGYTETMSKLSKAQFYKFLYNQLRIMHGPLLGVRNINNIQNDLETKGEFKERITKHITNIIKELKE